MVHCISTNVVYTGQLHHEKYDKPAKNNLFYPGGMIIKELVTGHTLKSKNQKDMARRSQKKKVTKLVKKKFTKRRN
jgi:hypothetical protein